MTGLSRRALLAALGLAGVSRARAASPLRVATLDWALLETLRALGVVPVAAAELVLYRRQVIEPAVPESVADLGLRGSPSFEALQLLAPDLILGSNYTAWAEPTLSRIAPVETFSIYGPGGHPYAAAEAATRAIAARLGIAPAGEALIAGTDAALAALKARLSGGDGHPVLVINLGDDRHFRVFGADSMFGEALTRLGLANAWRGSTRYSATAPMGLETLAQVGDAWIVLLPPVPPEARRMMGLSAFWKALPSVRAGRIVELAPVNPFGALPAALRFARLLTDALPFAKAAARG